MKKNYSKFITELKEQIKCSDVRVYFSYDHIIIINTRTSSILTGSIIKSALNIITKYNLNFYVAVNPLDYKEVILAVY